MSSIDLSNPPPGYSVKVDKEEDAATRVIRLAKDGVLFLSALLVMGVLLYHAVQGMQSDNAETQKWAMGFISATGGALIGYLVKK